MAKKVRISFPLKTPAQMAERLGISRTRLGRLLNIADNGSGDNRQRSVRVAFKSKGHGVKNSRSARRGDAKTTR
jgi:hypothetical protein